MRRIWAAVAALALAGALTGLPNFISAQSTSSWPTFKGDATRDGFSTVSGTQSNTFEQWILPKAVESSPVVDANGIAYLGDDDHNVYAFDPAMPTLPKWSYDTKAMVTATPALSPDGKTLYVGAFDGNFFALNTGDGSKRWSVNLGGPVHGSAIVSSDGSTIYINNINGTVYALNSSDGSTKWTQSLNGFSVPGSLAASPDGSTLYVATSGSIMYGLPASGPSANATGSVFYLKAAATGTPAVDSGGNIYVATSDGSLTSYGSAGGMPRWSFTVPSLVPSYSSPAVSSNGTVIWGSNDKHIYAISSGSGTSIWSYTTGAAVESSAAIAGGNNTAYIGSDDGKVYALPLSNGNPPVWTKDTGVEVTASPAIAADGSVWVASMSGYVYRFTTLNPPGTPSGRPPTATPGPSSTPFPTFTPGPTATGGTPTPTSTPVSAALTVTLKARVKAGSKQTISVKTVSNARVKFRVEYPNGDHQSAGKTSNAGGAVTYSYTQGGSKIRHNAFTAKVIVKAGTGAGQATVTKQYTILYGPMDVSVEPRTQAAGKIINVYVHTRVHTRVSAFLVFPNGRVITVHGTTGPKGWAHIRYKIDGKLVSGSNRKVTVLAKPASGTPNISAQTNFTVK